MKRIAMVVVTFGVGALIAGCPSLYKVTKETPATKSLSDYKQIYVGWLDLQEEDWQKYEFESKEIWKGEIAKHNNEGVRAYLKEDLGDRVIGGASSKDEAFPTKGDLFIKFKFDRINQTHDMWGSADELFLDVEFVDISSKEPVYKASVMVIGGGVFPRNWKASSFDGRLDNEMYNLATLLAEKLQ